jgi:hypothetical protein
VPAIAPLQAHSVGGTTGSISISRFHAGFLSKPHSETFCATSGARARMDLRIYPHSIGSKRDGTQSCFLRFDRNGVIHPV